MAYVDKEVFADALGAAVSEAIKYQSIVDIDNTLADEGGATIHVPVFDYIGDAEDVAEGTALTAVSLASTDTEVTVKEAGKAVSLTRRQLKFGSGQAMDESVRQLKIAISKKINSDVFTTLSGITSPMTTDIANIMGGDAVADALTLFGESDDESELKVLFVHPKQLAQIRKDDNFIRYQDTKTYTDGANGKLYGCEVVVSNNVELKSGKYTNYIVKKGAVKIYAGNPDNNIDVDEQYDVLARKLDIAATLPYVTYLYDKSKAIKFTTLEEAPEVDVAQG